MADRGPVKAYDQEQLFQLYYNGGQRRTYQQVVEVAAKEIADSVEDGEPFDAPSYATIRRYADEFDWDRRADALDEEARKIADKRLAALVAKQRVRNIEAVSTLTTKFFRRLIPSTADNPNPAEIQPEDIEIGDFGQLVKLFELLTGGATSRVGVEGDVRLQEMERAILEMDAREFNDDMPALPAGGG